MQSIRRAACAGTFYPGQAPALSQLLASQLAPAPVVRPPKALIVPHAGYVYSGPIAASAYSQLAGAEISRVVLIGPAHRFRFQGIALPEAGEFATPLGNVPVDAESIAQISQHPLVSKSEKAHAFEHSLEVQLPFLQSVLRKFSLIPLLLGDVEATTVAQILEQLWGGPETLIVASSDLSHFLSYEEAVLTDLDTASSILSLSPTIDHAAACGATPINSLLLAAKAKKLVPELLDLKNSGDTAGDRDRVVGYASFAFYQEPTDAK